MNPNRIRLIAIRPISPDGAKEEDRKSALAIQKKLSSINCWLYFHEGYTLEDAHDKTKDSTITIMYGKTLSVRENAYQDESLFNPIQTESTEDNICINIGAIVGSNGSGKSSTVDLLIRIINNFAAAYLGEGYRNAASDHLYYIENVYGSLVFELGGTYYIIIVQGRSLKIGKYEKRDDCEYICYFMQDILDNENSQDKTKILSGASDNRIIDLAQFFYTTVYNYSMYSFNYLDFFNERTIEDRWQSKQKRREESEKRGQHLPKDYYRQDDVWLNGLFHKNDGYQVPLVLNPLREEGVIDIPNENKLARERLLSMLFYSNSKEKELNKEHRLPVFPFRTINQNLYVVELVLKEYEQPSFLSVSVLHKLNLDKRTYLKENFNEIRKAIIDSWQETFQFKRGESTPAEKLAWDYVVYKTLKISKNYNLQYGKILDNLTRSDFKKSRLHKHIFELSEDDSHITLKLRRAIYYLKFKLYGDALTNTFDINDIYLKIQDIQVDPTNAIYRYRKNELFANVPDETELAPPPIFNINFNLIDKKYLKKDWIYPDDKLFSMEGLSSGERQVAYSISNLVYHIVNLDSVWDCGQDYVSEQRSATIDSDTDDYVKRVLYKYVNVIFDEVELYFHPDLQRRYVASLISALRNVRLRHIKGVSILMVTHSPFVLSDIPKSNILFLGDKRYNVKETFAANLHDILNNHFFMDYSIGENARNIINQFFHVYVNDKKIKEKQGRKIWQQYKEKFLYLRDIVGDTYLHSEINKMFNELLSKYGTRTELEARKRELQNQISSIDKLLSHDKG